MKKIKLKRINLDYPEDCRRIVRVLAYHGFLCSLQEAQSLWSDYSYNSAAGWLFLPDDDEELFSALQSVIEEEEL